MFLLDTNVISERRKGIRGDVGVSVFFAGTKSQIYLPVQVIGELRQGIENLKQRGDMAQAQLLEVWFSWFLKNMKSASWSLICKVRWYGEL